MKFDTILFDLDGTLVDSAPDLVGALNFILDKYNHNVVDFDKARLLVSKGGKALIRFGFNIDDSHHNFLDYHQEFLTYYENNIAIHSKLFAGMETVISNLSQWGIVTNKPTELTHQLLDKLKLKPDIVICGDTLNTNKPSGEPIIYAMKQLRVNNALMVGDDEVDVLAAKNAGVKSALVSWGYSDLTNVTSDYFVNKAEDLKQWII